MDNPSHPKLRSGLKAEVFVITSIKEDILRIRNGSYYTGAGDYTLFIYKDEHTLVPRTVHLGDCNYDYVEVISGLEEGDSVVVSDMQRYKGKEKIRINE
jgi:HlyD family secretion protein